MSASMRSTLQTVPESVPADHVTNSKVSTKTWGTSSSLRSCNRNCSFSRTKRRAVSARSCERVLSAHHKVLENVRLLRSVGARSKALRAVISYVRVPTIFSISLTEENVITAGTTRSPFRRSIMCLVTQNVLRVWLKVERLRLEEGLRPR